MIELLLWLIQLIWAVVVIMVAATIVFVIVRLWFNLLNKIGLADWLTD